MPLKPVAILLVLIASTTGAAPPSPQPDRR